MNIEIDPNLVEASVTEAKSLIAIGIKFREAVAGAIAIVPQGTSDQAKEALRQKVVDALDPLFQEKIVSIIDRNTAGKTTMFHRYPKKNRDDRHWMEKREELNDNIHSSQSMGAA